LPVGYAEGTVADLNAAADLLSMMQKNFKQKLITATGKSEEEINALLTARIIGSMLIKLSPLDLPPVVYS